MSVTMIAPRPRSTRPTAAAIRARMSSGVSLYVVGTLSTPSSGPRTPSSVCTISSASRPCPTTTIPTIDTKFLLPRWGCGKRTRLRPSALGVAVADAQAMAAGLEPSAELLDQYDRAVAPSGAADGDG